MRSEIVQKYLPGAREVLPLIEAHEDTFCLRISPGDIIYHDCIHFLRICDIFKLPRCIRLGCVHEPDILGMLGKGLQSAERSSLYVGESHGDEFDYNNALLVRMEDLVNLISSHPPPLSLDKWSSRFFKYAQVLYAEAMYLSAESKYLITLRLLDHCSESIIRSFRPLCLLNIALTRMRRCFYPTNLYASLSDSRWDAIYNASPLQLLTLEEATACSPEIYVLRSLAYETLRRYPDAIASLDTAMKLLEGRRTSSPEDKNGDIESALKAIKQKQGALRSKAARVLNRT